MKQLGVFVGFAPWIAFTVISGPGTWGVAASTPGNRVIPAQVPA